MAISDISLTSGMRGSLLSLQGNAKSIDRSQERLSTGRKVNSALDNPTNFFASMAHNNRAGDLLSRKDSVKEAIQNITAANNGITAISSLLQAANGLANAALGTTAQADRDSFADQFEELISQIDSLASDSSYRGTNLLKSDSLMVNFAEATGSSTLTIAGVDATSTGLGVESVSLSGGTIVTDQSIGTGADIVSIPTATPAFTYSGSSLNIGDTFTFTIDNSGNPHTTPTTLQDTLITPVAILNVNSIQTEELAKTDISFSGDSKSMTLTINSLTDPIATGDNVQFLFYPDGGQQERTFSTDNAIGELSNIKVGGVLKTAETDYNLITRSGDGKADIVFTPGNGPANGTTITADVSAGGNSWTSTSGIETSLAQLEAAITAMRSNAKNLANNSTILTTRLDYISSMANILQTGADKLILADMNEEGANMLLLQTRQSLGTTGLSMSAQSAQSVMRLF